MTAHPSNLTAETAERQRDAAEARRESFLPTREAALEDLVDRIMEGKWYPLHASLWARVSMHDILVQVDQSVLAEAVRAHLADPLMNDLSDAVEKFVHAYFDGPGSKWVDLRQQDMAAEAEEDAE